MDTDHAAAFAEAIPQSEPLDDRQQRNNAGGFVYTVTDLTRFRRFLVLGSDSGTYYVTKATLTFENAACLVRLLANGQGLEAVREIVAISNEGRAAKQGPGLYALAMAARLGDLEVRRAALAALPDVCRTASTLFEFVRYCSELGEIAGAARGVTEPKQRASWGRGMRKAVAGWYMRQAPRDLAYQVTKYAQRQGWTHKDLLRLSHPNAEKAAAAAAERRQANAGAGPSGTAPAATATPAVESPGAGTSTEDEAAGTGGTGPAAVAQTAGVALEHDMGAGLEDAPWEFLDPEEGMLD